MSQLFSGRNIEKERSNVYEQTEKNKADLVAAEETIQRLQGESVDLKRRLNKATSFINNLPEDILSELFLDLCDESIFSLVWAGSPRQFLIGSVCHHWRQVAWRTHGLWRKLFIIFRETHCDVQKVLIEEWLERSGEYPVELWLSLSSKDGYWQPPSGTFDKILESCHRWESLSIFPFKSLLSALEKESTRQFSSLKSLYFEASPLQATGSQNVWKFNKPPQLQHLLLRSLPNSSLDLDWGVLTSLTADITLHSSNAIPITITTLSSCTSLTTLYFTFIEEDENDVLAITPGALQLPSLKGMTLTVDHSSSLDPLIQFLSLLVVPSLESLHLSAVGDHQQEGEWLHPLISLARRSSFRLLDLSLDLGDMSDTHVQTLIQEISPSNPIKRLHLSSGSVEDGFPLSNRLISQMILNPEDRPELQKQCLPALSDFFFVGDLSCSLNSLARFLKSRSARVENRIEDGPSEPCLWIDIRYNNREWLGQQNPNAVQAFYREVEELSRKGVRFNLEWNTHQTRYQGMDEDDNE